MFEEKKTVRPAKTDAKQTGLAYSIRSKFIHFLPLKMCFKQPFLLFGAYNYFLYYVTQNHTLIFIFYRSSPSGSTEIHRNGPGTIYLAGALGFRAVSSISSDRYLTYEFQFLFSSFNFDLYLVNKLKTKTDKLNQTKNTK